MDIGETIDEITRLIIQKAVLREKFSIRQCILLIGIYESDFDIVVALTKEIPSEDFLSTGFEEIWLVDFKGIRDGAHREVRLFGLYPDQYRHLTGRSMYDQKPYG
jgi:hypothetical protein